MTQKNTNKMNIMCYYLVQYVSRNKVSCAHCHVYVACYYEVTGFFFIKISVSNVQVEYKDNSNDLSHGSIVLGYP